MYNLGPEARKRQQMMLQKNKSPNLRQTRQFDSSKQTRTTFNSRNEKLLNIDQDHGIKKKQKLQHHNNNTNNVPESTSINENATTVEKNNTARENMAYSDEEYDSKNLEIQKYSVSRGILGDGHTQILHAYVRETLFKNIKILSPSHLETSGEIMQEILRLLKYSETRNGNLTAFSTACRIEVRKAMSSRRGYVKRLTGITVAGKLNYF